MKAKRIRYYISFVTSKGSDYWKLTQGRALVMTCAKKGQLVKDAAVHCRLKLSHLGERSELFIKDKAGVIRETRTYGADPRRTKG